MNALTIKKKMTSDDSPQARGDRLKRVRAVTGLNRRAFAVKYKIKEGTLQNWETGRCGGLNERGAKMILEALKQENVSCSLEWLLYQNGSSPLEAIEPHRMPQIVSTQSMIARELALFQQNHGQVIDIIVPDNAMMPRFVKGEIVAGNRLFEDDIDKALHLDCIVQLTDGKILLRQLKKGDKWRHYTLSFTHHDPNTQPKILENITLFSAAPVIWSRRQDPFGKF